MSSADGGRLDAALVDRGLVRSRTLAARLIADGLVTVDGRPAVKPSLRVGSDSRIEVAAGDSYVSRGAHKLIAALDGFRVPVAGRLALDAGASTGGFTQVLLERRARRVLAVDVGHGQLAAEIARDPRVSAHEGVNVRDLTPALLASLSGSFDAPELVVADLSFISLRQVLPALRSVAGERADFVLLVKPQFEVGRQGIREGIVRDSGRRADAVAGVLWAGWDAGLRTGGVLPSPIAGGAGNAEYLVHLSAGEGTDPGGWEPRLPGMTA